MKAGTDNKMTLCNNLVVAENPELARVFGDSVFFPQKNEQAKELIRKYGLPKELTK
ncbi:hypothetical protein [Spirosoma sp.]|uniref:hypothetical protein n=1 Tax=Spirosoma sp. TaxID=1899569 RepID=UPI0026119B76|nr:hypothetical protein [Spirosoma sp.]MCX6219006.1 hypothetical protein [Spirosoma sp.]